MKTCESRNVLVTGAAGGMGRAACDLLVRAGYRVWGIDLAEDAPSEGFRYLSADVTDPASLERAFETVRTEAGTLGAILHMAGIYWMDSLVEMTEEEFRKVFDVNLFGVVRVNRIFLPLLAPHARILITTSELAPLDPLPFTGIYAISKAALENYAFSLRMELQLLGHQVVVLRPGAVRTGLLDVSTRSLARFCDKTALYSCNAERFRSIVNRVETRSVPPAAVAGRALKALRVRRPKFVYNLNRNAALRLLNLLPGRMQTAIIRGILKEKKGSSSSNSQK